MTAADYQRQYGNKSPTGARNPPTRPDVPEESRKASTEPIRGQKQKPSEEELDKLGRQSTPDRFRYGRYAGYDSNGFQARRFCGLDQEQADELDKTYHRLTQQS